MSFSPMLNVLLLLLVVQLADRTFTLQQKEFLCLPYRLSFLNHSPSEWFSVYKKAPSLRELSRSD